ncbi:pumilio homolog 3-like isoform X2 [Lycorma delicatula]|uniref:pumilio homolog 3-like isoform X2 n=1 Tax=Lycorma delicatula TaxID=130591 RepID=UPI003F5154FE
MNRIVIEKDLGSRRRSYLLLRIVKRICFSCKPILDPFVQYKETTRSRYFSLLLCTFVLCVGVEVNRVCGELPSIGVKKTTKPNWLEFKKKKKELKKTRREQRNPQYEITIKAKKIWEEVRNHNCPKDKRSSLVTELHSILKGKLGSVIHSHDMARIVQCLLKFGTSDVRIAVCEELLPHITATMLSKYGCYCIKPLFIYSNNDHRKLLIDGMIGHIVKLLNHSIASRWLEYAYSTWASQSQKLIMRQELYGNLFKLSKDETVSTLSDLFAKNPQVKPAILLTTKSIISKALEKKHIMVSSLLHSVMHDYMNHCDSVERNELLESLVESLLQLLTSRDGTIVAMNIVWHGTNKMKKTTVKMLKTHVKEVSELEHGHLLLLALFDSVDDTVLIKKALFPELLSVAEEMAVDEIGRRVLLHLTVHRDKSYFHPAEIELLQQGDQIGTSKKSANVKHKELFEGLIDPLLTLIANNPSHWLGNSSVSMLTLAVVKSASTSDSCASSDKLKDVHSKIALYIINDGKTDRVEDGGLNFVIKKLIQHDKNILSNDKELSTFSSTLVDFLTESILESWIKINRACFLLVGLIESGDTTAATQLKSKFTKNFKNLLKNETTAGAKVLHKKAKEK